MKLCIVGNGPSAKGHGAEIDACDFVVRIKAFWENAAVNAGQRVDAVAWLGTEEAKWKKHGPDGFDHWRTWCSEQYIVNGGGWPARKVFFETFAEGKITHRLSGQLHLRVKRSTLKDPSTGIIAIAMALDILEPAELLLYGFDGTLPTLPNYHDARRAPEIPKKGEQYPHDQLREKRVIAGLLNGKWLGEPSTVKLIWPDMPDLK